MQVKKNTLLLLACLVWTAAGVNILRIGLLAYATQVSLPHILLSLLVFFLFQVFVFGRLVGKHTRRILGYWEDRQFFLRFFDALPLFAEKTWARACFSVSPVWRRTPSWPCFTLVWGPPCCWPASSLAGTTAGRSAPPGPDRPCQ